MTIAIIGAGMAGLSLASALSANGQSLKLFDKGRGPGGRMSTRRMETPLGQLRWDHGAQYITVSDPAFDAAMQSWVSAGAAARWDGTLASLSADGQVMGDLGAAPRYVGAPSMNAIIKHMAEGHDVTWGRRASRIETGGHSAQVIFEDGRAEGPFEAVLVTVPAEQAVDLLEEPAPEMAAAAASVESAPCWTVLLAFDAPLDVAFDGAKVEDHALGWIARNAAKPGRDSAEAWVLQASPDWSRAHLEDQPADVTIALMEAFRTLTGAPAPVFQTAHRWRYSQVVKPAGQVFWDHGLRIGACGDWCLGGKAQAAWQSGQQLADVLTAK